MIYAVDWGDFPTWISAMGAVFALVFAAFAVIAARNTFRIESKSHALNTEAQRAHEASLRRAQAATVSAWWEHDRPEQLTISTRNASDVPVYQAHVTVISRRSESIATKLDIPVLPPSDHPSPCELPETFAQRFRAGFTTDDLRVRLTFTDSAGVRWVRDEYGQLGELKSSLVIWAYRPIAAVLDRFTAEFQRAYGVTVKFAIKESNELREQFLAAWSDTDSAQAADVDILFAPHDWTGDLVDAGTVIPAVLSERGREYFTDMAIDALSADNTLYGIPAMLNTTVLYRNLDLAPDEPATIEQLLAAGTSLVQRRRVNEVLALQVGEGGDPFHLHPLYTSAGGWLFGTTAAGEWDLGTIGVGQPESIAAFERLQALGETGSGVLRRDIGRTQATDLFLNRETAFLVASARVAPLAHNAGIDFGISRVPPFADGGPAESFVGVDGFFIARKSPNRIFALDLIADFLCRPEAANALAQGLAAPVPVRDFHAAGPVHRTVAEACARGRLMPSGPAMPQVWRLLGAAQARIIAGDDVRLVANQLAADLSAVNPGAGSSSG